MGNTSAVCSTCMLVYTQEQVGCLWREFSSAAFDHRRGKMAFFAPFLPCFFPDQKNFKPQRTSGSTSSRYQAGWAAELLFCFFFHNSVNCTMLSGGGVKSSKSTCLRRRHVAIITRPLCNSPCRPLSRLRFSTSWASEVRNCQQAASPEETGDALRCTSWLVLPAAGKQTARRPSRDPTRMSLLRG